MDRHLFDEERVIRVQEAPEVDVDRLGRPGGAEEPDGLQGVAAVLKPLQGGQQVGVVLLVAPVQLVADARIRHDRISCLCWT
jgi:hypothetical protein